MELDSAPIALQLVLPTCEFPPVEPCTPCPPRGRGTQICPGRMALRTAPRSADRLTRAPTPGFKRYSRWRSVVSCLLSCVESSVCLSFFLSLVSCVPRCVRLLPVGQLPFARPKGGGSRRQAGGSGLPDPLIASPDEAQYRKRGGGNSHDLIWQAKKVSVVPEDAVRSVRARRHRGRRP